MPDILRATLTFGGSAHLAVGHSVLCATEAALARGVVREALPQCSPVEVWPRHVNEHVLGIRRFPQQEVRGALFAPGADEEVDIGKVWLVHVLANQIRINLRRSNLAPLDVERKFGRSVGNLSSSTVIHTEVQDDGGIAAGQTLGFLEFFEDRASQSSLTARPNDFHTP